MSAKSHLKRDNNYAQQKVEAELVAMKVCSRCNNNLLIEDFDVDQTKVDGRKSVCKTCRSLDSRQEVVDTNVKLKEFLMRMDVGVLDNLAASDPGGTNVPHRIQFLEETIALIGGVRGLAMMYVANLQASNVGSAQKQRMLDKLVTLISDCSDDGKVSKPREMMSDEELEAAAMQRAIRIAQDTIPQNVKESA